MTAAFSGAVPKMGGWLTLAQFLGRVGQQFGLARLDVGHADRF